jgi:DNA invertase Pin-like site-specific DNA recombinase
MKYVIYLRVSTDQQTESGLGLEAQRQIAQHLNNNRIFNRTGPWNHVSISRVMK